MKEKINEERECTNREHWTKKKKKKKKKEKKRRSKEVKRQMQLIN